MGIAYGSETVDNAAAARHAERLSQANLQGTGLVALQAYLRSEQVPLQEITGDLHDVTLYGHHVGRFIMESVTDTEGVRINPGMLTSQMNRLAALRVTDRDKYKAKRDRANARIVEVLQTESVPELNAAKQLEKETTNNDLQPLVSHALVAMGLILDTGHGRRHMAKKPASRTA